MTPEKVIGVQKRAFCSQRVRLSTQVIVPYINAFRDAQGSCARAFDVLRTGQALWSRLESWRSPTPSRAGGTWHRWTPLDKRGIVP
jgi:hypothetical protein